MLCSTPASPNWNHEPKSRASKSNLVSSRSQFKLSDVIQSRFKSYHNLNLPITGNYSSGRSVSSRKCCPCSDQFTDQSATNDLQWLTSRPTIRRTSAAAAALLYIGAAVGLLQEEWLLVDPGRAVHTDLRYTGQLHLSAVGKTYNCRLYGVVSVQ